jgi:tetratricopeptide (TPR) repeat protein
MDVRKLSRDAVEAYRLQNYDESLQILRQLCKIKPSSKVANNIVVLECKLANLQPLPSKIVGDNDCARFNRSILHFKNGDYEACLQELIPVIPPADDNQGICSADEQEDNLKVQPSGEVKLLLSFKAALLAIECYLSLDQITKATGQFNSLQSRAIHHKASIETMHVLRNRIEAERDMPIFNKTVASKSSSLTSSPQSLLLAERMKVIKARLTVDPQNALAIVDSQMDPCLRLYHLALLNVRWRRYAVAAVFLYKALDMCVDGRRMGTIKRALAATMCHVAS